MYVSRAYHPTITKCKFLSSAHGVFVEMYLIPSHKTSLNKFQIIQLMQSISSDHNRIKLEINTRNISGKIQNIWNLVKIIVNGQ
jgi:hypothetical protein